MPLMTTFFWNNASFTGSSQLDIGPFFIGFVNKIYKMEADGEANYQGSVLGTSSVFANFLAWAVQKVPHGTAANDLVSTADGEDWFIRRQTGSEDYATSWAPNTSNAGVLAGVKLVDKWAGQLAIGADTDLFVSFKSSTGASLANFNTFGTVRIWWN